MSRMTCYTSQDLSARLADEYKQSLERPEGCMKRKEAKMRPVPCSG